MNDDQLLRYSRQILLPDIGVEGQQRLLDAHVLVVGAGGLGSPAALYLAAAGVGRLTIADDDEVELSNLQRQILHRHDDLGRAKVESARDTLRELNPDVRVTPLQARLDAAALDRLATDVDLVIDASDNFATRFAINEACVRSGTPLVSGAAVRMEGQLSVFLPQRSDSPCYRCLYSEGEDPAQTCADNGVLAPVVGVIGSLQALEAIKILLGQEDILCGELLLFDARHLEWRSLKLRRDPACPVCGDGSD
ncbi:MAG TPA: molybdopterin-synthase adenylyltransferase MoeB [Gammaproteobacteria bacterium]|nr:molybdopterin-synthase adenylyltransferase MoeB [Gammaproteobacteria bacterium]